MSLPPEKPPALERTDSLLEASLDPDDTGISRETFLSLSRSYLTILKGTLAAYRADGMDGRAFVRKYSQIVDALVGVLFQRAAAEHGVSADKSDIAIIGMGGYGRAELAPFSDVDILVLCRRRTPGVKQIASTFVRLMWDVGFELGHAVESLIESESTLFRHMDTRTALFESRWICGSKRIAREVERRIKQMRKTDREAFLSRKIRDALVRHRKYSNSYQLIEPNVKLSPGGLRDFQTLVWLAMGMRASGGLGALRRKGLLLPGEEKALQAAHDFVLQVRVELHLATESKQDQLTIGMQTAIAKCLGYRPRGGHLAVELFMRDYYTRTRTIYRIMEDVIEQLDFGKSVGLLLGHGKTPRAADKLRARISARKIRKEPLYIFLKQKEAGLRMDRALRYRLEQALRGDLKGRVARARMRRDFPRMLDDGSNLSLVLRAMHETGFLGAIIPEYNDLTSLKRYDLYHHYTVDEHSFQVIRNLETLASVPSRRADPLKRLYFEVQDKQVLFLTALLHDIGKIGGRGHAKKGAVLARKILRRLGVTNDVAERVSYLIEIHLVMSHYAQRRDPSDIGTLRAFCAQVKNRTNLKYLCLLTYADLKATSPVVWNEWKRGLLWALYLKAYEFMAQREKRPDAFYQARKRTLLRAFRGEEKKRALAHLDLLPGRYLLMVTAAQVRRHMALVDALRGQRAVVDCRAGKVAAKITFCTHDKTGLLSQLCGVLALNDCNILFANAFTRADGTVLNVFSVRDVSGTMRIDDARVESIRVDLDNVLRGRLDIREAVERHVVKWKRKRETSIPTPLRVEFENDVSGDVTIIDIYAMDRPGLLFKITRALSEEGLTIHRARISTEANRAIDSFDAQDARGRKITGVAKLRRIRERLARELD